MRPLFSQIMVLTIGLSLAAIGARAERSPIYPFNVSLGGQEAVHDGEAASIFAAIANPVAADATFEVDTAPGMIIINAFPIDAAGSPILGKPTKIIMVQDGTSGSLADTMDKSPFEPGTYGMNVVADGKTSRVKFTIK